ncbi:MAG TPA: DEAD/DEAH box helicase family protein [Sedimentisphaerales bacterium]|nr:DEAD/DEAH box helicase family protein [Sedimentisphaerales bacterium]
MNTFPPGIRFRKPWRSYQQRVLTELEQHLDDNHLHVIAAPGSGKTVLGLEVMRQLNRPTLILAPSLAIRDQWVDRFVNLFLDAGQGTPKWISKDIRAPRFLTVSTYQGLHMAYRGETDKGSKSPGRDAILKRLKQLGVKTLVLDEAHHLRNEWWKCLADLKKQLDGPTIVALTATPPFDVSPHEWEKYIGLCGPIDAEISVPELVAQKNLCPHQDYVLLSAPLQAEQQQIREFRAEVEKFVKDLCENESFIAALENHPNVAEPQEHVEEILDDPDFYSSVGFFLNHVRKRPPQKLLSALGLSRRKCPGLDAEWIETLLAGCFHTHVKSFAGHKETISRILREAKRIGIVERWEVGLRSVAKIAKLLIRSASKLKSVEDIVRLETQSLGSDLRMVTLTDFIRQADFPSDSTDAKPIRRLGVVPIFEQIRRGGAARLGILTGTLTVVPTDSQEVLRSIAPSLGIDPPDIAFKPLAHDPRFSEVTIRGADKQKMVGLITALFNRGGVNILVGTTSLLGEGWDAPSVNSLILASVVGSYMLSNQMRGRAIRTQEGKPDKTANIWHLVCQEPDAPHLDEDMETLTRRFKSFVGVSFTKPRITSGLGRLGLGRPPYTAARMQHINAVMQRKACDRPGLICAWERALAHAKGADIVEQVAVSEAALPRDFVFRNAVLALLWQACLWAVAAASVLMYSRGDESRVLLLILSIASALAALAALPRYVRVLWRLLWHGSATSSLRQVGKAVLRSMIQAGAVETDFARLRVVASRLGFGLVGCSLQGGSTRERSVFLEALQELLGPVEDPRYLLIRRSSRGWFARKDYHSVPRALGKNKETAEHLRKMWSLRVGPADLVYTRTPEGLRFLLNARARSMAAGFDRRAERFKSWQ